MNILLLGGTGAMGTHLSQILKERGCNVWITSRKKRASIKNVHYLQGNAKDIEFIKKILPLANWNAIIDFMVYDTNTFKTHSKILLKNTSHYIFLSSARVYANSDKQLTEQSPRLLDYSSDKKYIQSNEYAITKAKQENILYNTQFKNWTIIRPYITYSENRLQLGILEKEEWLYRAIQGKSLVFPTNLLNKKTTLTYGYDVANGINSIIGLKQSYEQVYHITTNDSITWETILKIYCNTIKDILHIKPKIIYVTDEEFLRCKSAKYQYYYDRMYHRTFNNNKISHFINTSSFEQTKKGLIKCLESLLKRPSFNSINWRNEALQDRLTKEHTKLYNIPTLKSKIKYMLFRYSPYLPKNQK